MKLRYNNTNWTVPLLKENKDLALALDKVFKHFNIENPIKTLYDYMLFPVSPSMTLFNNFLTDNSTYNPAAEFDYGDYYINPAILYDEFFAKCMSFMNEHNVSLVLSNNFLYNYVKKSYGNIKLIASEEKSINEMKDGQEIEYYENLLTKYDKVILSPKYVKDKFFNDYKNFSDLSRFEIYANYISNMSTNLDEKYSTYLALSTDEMKKLTEEIGIKNFRIHLGTNSLGYCLDSIFNYIIEPDALSLFMLDEIIKIKKFSECTKF